jgi:lipoprotein-anchoring transpeptidase ErfK/SrfK
MLGRVILAVIAGVAVLAPWQALQAETGRGGLINGAKYNFGAEPWSIEAKFHKQEVSLDTAEKPGTIIISTRKRYLYLVLGKGRALRYGIGVGRIGFKWAGIERVTRKAEWPDWHPPKEMRRRDPTVPEFMKGGPDNPLGARAMYLGNTEYRIHGTAQPWTIGTSVSSGCIRLTNDDVTDLYGRVKVGAKVIVE